MVSWLCVRPTFCMSFVLFSIGCLKVVKENKIANVKEFLSTLYERHKVQIWVTNMHTSFSNLCKIYAHITYTSLMDVE